MKFDPFNWSEVKTNEENQTRKGWLRLRLSTPCPLYITAQGVEALAGCAASFDVQISEAVTFRVDAPDGVRAFLHVPERTSFKPEGEVFTNIDRMPDESGSLLEVKRALRKLELERRSILREIRSERSALQAERAEIPQGKTSLPPEPAPEPAPEPVPGPEAKK